MLCEMGGLVNGNGVRLQPVELDSFAWFWHAWKGLASLLTARFSHVTWVHYFYPRSLISSCRRQFLSPLLCTTLSNLMTSLTKNWTERPDFTKKQPGSPQRNIRYHKLQGYEEDCHTVEWGWCMDLRWFPRGCRFGSSERHRSRWSV